MLTPEQIADRVHFIGASEASAILTYPDGGPLNPWKEPLDVYAAKVSPEWALNEGPIDVLDDGGDGEDEDEENPFSRVHLDVGNAVEPVIISLWEAKFGRRVVRQGAPEHPGTVRHPRYPMIAATPDGLLPDAGLECKWSGSRRRRDWGASGTEIPDYYMPQVQLCMEVFDRPCWHVAALVDGSPRFYLVERDQALIDVWVARLVDWWQQHVVARVAPEPRSSGTERRYLDAQYPRSTGNELPATIEDHAVGRLLAQAKQRAKAIGAEVESLENALKARIGTADGIAGVATWKTDATGRVAWKGVAEAMKPPHAMIEKFRSAPGRRFLLKVKGEV